jgi:polyisoprenoid-binding protein YceI
MKRLPTLHAPAHLTVFAALAITIAPRAGAAATFLVHPGGESKVVFVSRAPMEKFEGKTNRLEGRIEVDPARLGDSASVHLEVDLASLDTGIAKRNQHMREDHLETAKYPKAVFSGVAVHAPGAVLEPGKPMPLDVEGTFTLHGVSRRIRLTVQTTYLPREKGDQIAFEATFPVGLSDYQISRPQFLFMKLADTQEVQVKGVAVASP